MATLRASALIVVAAAACETSPPCRGLAPCNALPTCPRDAIPDRSGRCACRTGLVEALGACVAPDVGASYCGASARLAAEGCAFRACSADEGLDLGQGCIPIAAVTRGGPGECPAGASLVIEDARTACVPAAAACPRGTEAGGATCARLPGCPPGTLPFHGPGGCLAIVSRGGPGTAIVDVASWAARILGQDGGEGSAELCRPLAQRPGAFGLSRGETLPLRVRVVLRIPDQDLSRVEARVDARAAPAGTSLPPGADALVERAVATLVEPLRGLGGQAAAASVEVEVRCSVASL